MSDIEIYLYSNCSSCKNASALLEDLGVSAVRRDTFKEKLSVAEIKALFNRTSLDPMAVLSKRSRPYAELGLANRILTDAETIELMSHYPALMRRPIVVKDHVAVIGFNRTAIAALVARK